MATVHAHSSLERASQIARCWLIMSYGHSSRVLGLGRFVPFHLLRSTPAQPDDKELHKPPEQLRAALEELGQMLPTRDDLLPPGVVCRIKLQNLHYSNV